MAHHSKPKTSLTNLRINRRWFLKSGSIAAAAWILSKPIWAEAKREPHRDRSLAFYNTHTGEYLQSTVYWRDGEYIGTALANIDYILRDHRAHELTDMDTRLLNLLYLLKVELGAQKPFHVISGYRSQETNERLRKRSNGVAKNSLHMQGKAIDIRIP